MNSLRCFAAFMIMLLAASPLWAQDVPRAPDSGGWIVMVIAIVLIVAVAVVSFMSAKRGHQD